MKILFISYWQKRINRLNQVLSIGICFSFISIHLLLSFFERSYQISFSGWCFARLGIWLKCALFDWILNCAHPCSGVHAYETLSVAGRLECYVH